MWAAVVAIALTAEPKAPPMVNLGDLELLHRDVERNLVGPLAALVEPLRAARAGSDVKVATVRERLKAMRTLEAAERKLILTTNDKQTYWAHAALAMAWAELGQLEGELSIQGEGDGPLRDAVRSEAKQRALDAESFAADEFDLAKHPEADSGPAIQLHLPALQACWNEHLLRFGSDSLDTKADISISEFVVTRVTFTPQLQAARRQLRECLISRISGWRNSMVDTPPSPESNIELPLHFTAPK